MHLRKKKNEILCKDLYVGEWKEEVVTDPSTGQCTRSEYFNGNVKMERKQDQLYLVDMISANFTHLKNVQQRMSKGIGITNQVMQILESTYFGKYYFIHGSAHA